MRKKLLISLICGNLLLGSSVSAESPFADAPSWSYQPVAELIDAKIIDGADARNFSVGEIMTRYDMARLVGRAVYKIDKADAAQKEIIIKLAEEFKDELDYFKTPLKVQPSETEKIETPAEDEKTETEENVTEIQSNLNPNLEGPTLDDVTSSVEEKLRKEKKLPPFAFGAYARQIFEYTANPPQSTQKYANLSALDHRSNYDNHTSYFFYVIANLEKNYKFVTRFGVDDSTANDRSGVSSFGLHWAALVGDIGHGTRIRLGRQNLNLGYGTVASVGKNWDGINLINKQGNSTWSAGYFIRSDWRHRRYFFLSNTTQLTPNLEIKTSYFKDSKSRIADTSAKNNGESLYNVVSFGGQYKFHAPFTLKAEIAHNKGNSVYSASNGYYIQLNYRETNLAKRGTWTTWLQYRNMDTGFNPMGFSELKEPIKMSTDATINSAAEGVHGFEYGFSYVPLKSMLATLKLWSLHHYDVQRSQFGTALQFEYLWR